MSEYKGIKGFQVQTRSEDPTPYAQALEDNPYVGSWSSGGNLNTGRGGIGGAGLQTAALAFAGNKIILQHLLLVKQNNMMVQVGQRLLI